MLIRQGWKCCPSERSSASTVLVESDQFLPELRSEAAEEFRNFGIPCDIYYLSFEKWILALQSRTCMHCIDIGGLSFQTDNGLQLRDSNTNVYGHFNERGRPLQSCYLCNGRHTVVPLSMLEQTCRDAQFWKQKMQCGTGPKNTTTDKAAKGNSTWHLFEAEGPFALSKQDSDQGFCSPCLKSLSGYSLFYEGCGLSAIISNNSCQLRCLVLTVFAIPLNGQWNALQLPILPVDGFKQKEVLGLDVDTQNLDSKMLWDSSTMLHASWPKDAGQTQKHFLEYFAGIAMVHHLFWPKVTEHYKKNGCSSGNVRKTKCGVILKDQSFSPLLYLSRRIPTEDSSLYNNLNKKKRNKGKCHVKDWDGHTVRVVCNESVQEFIMSEASTAKSNAVSTSGTILACEPFLVGLSSDINITGICINDDRVNADLLNSLGSLVKDSNNPEICTTSMVTATIRHSSWDSALKLSSAIVTGVDCGSEALQADIFLENYNVLKPLCSSIKNFVTLGQNAISKPQTRQILIPRFRSDDIICSQLMDCSRMMKITTLASNCQLTVPCSDQLPMAANITSCGGQGGFLGPENVGRNSLSGSNERTLCDSHAIGTETCFTNRDPSNVSNKGSVGCHGDGCVIQRENQGWASRCNNAPDKAMNGIKAVDNDEQTKRSPQGLGRELGCFPFHGRWPGCTLESPVVGGNKGSGSTIGPESLSAGVTHSFQGGIGHKTVGKENKHCIWQKVQKNTGCSYATAEPKAGEHSHVQSGHVSKDGLQVFKSAAAAITISVQELPTITQHYGNCGLNKEQSLEALENHNEHGGAQGNTYDNVLCKYSFQGNMPKSRRWGDATTVQQSPIWSSEKPNGANAHFHTAETGKGIWTWKQGSSQSNEHSISSQVGAVGSLQRSDCFLYIPQQKGCLSDTCESEQLRSSNDTLTLHENRDTCQVPTGILHHLKDSAQIQDSSNHTLSTLGVSISVEQMLLQRKQVHNFMTSARQIAGAQHTVDEGSFRPVLWKGRKATDFEKGASHEKSSQRDRPSHHVLQKWVRVKSKSVAMTDKGGDNEGNFLSSRKGKDGRQKECEFSNQRLISSAASHIPHLRTSTQCAKQENEKVISHTDVSAIPARQEAKRNNGDCEHVTVGKTGYVYEASIKQSSEVSKHVLCDGELKKMAHRVLKSINDSCRSQMASENITCSFGSPVAEFEKLLYRVSPVITPISNKQQCKNSSVNQFAGNSVCRCQVAHVPLRDIWKWYEEPGNYGLEVKAWDTQHSERLGINGNQFQAYFVPFLSGMQLFGFSSIQLGLEGARKGNATSSVPEPENLPILATHLPKASVANELDASKCLGSSSCSGSYACSISTEEVTLGDFGLLFEYFESERPQQRRPMFEKIRELTGSNAASNFQIFGGDPRILDSIKLGDLHPASWFAVAWYPVYRIPEGHLRAAFLTYHSLGNFLKRDASSNAHDRGTDSSVVAPVVGLQSYNSQAECWFVLRKEFKDFPVERLPSNPSKVLQERLKTLEETAASMATGLTRKCDALHTRIHSDYEFFLGRRK